VSGSIPVRASSIGPELLFEDACVLFALRRERRPFCRVFPAQQSFPGAPCWARFCGPPWLSVLVMETGVGQARTERAVRWLLSRPPMGAVRYRPKLILAAGFGGALSADLHTGDVVLATEIVDGQTGQSWPTTWPASLPPGPWSPPLHRGKLVTAPALVGTPAAKEDLGHRHSALIVDMETAAVARLCQAASQAFGCARVVLDELSTQISDKLVALLSSGRASPWRLARASLMSPSIVPSLLQMARQSEVAANALGSALGELLTLTLPWAAE
jgi:adenosylhomocysteine nucleosidase